MNKVYRRIEFILLTVREKCPNTKFLLIRIFPYSDWIQRKNLCYSHYVKIIQIATFFRFVFSLVRTEYWERIYFIHIVKSVQIRSFSWSVFFCILFEYGKYDQEKTPYLDCSCSVYNINFFSVFGLNTEKYLRNWTIFTQCQCSSDNKPTMVWSYRPEEWL